MVRATTVAAVAASSNHANFNSPYSQQKRPAPLNIPDQDQDQDDEPRLDDRPRRLSIGSDTSDAEDSPGLSALDSSAALMLVHDDSQDSQNLNLEFSDEEDPEDNDDIVSPVFEIRRTSIPPLPPSRIFLYLLSPYLKLGALTILPAADRLPLKYGLPALLVFAITSTFSRQVWYHLARYLRKADLMEILCHTFAKSRGKERQRRIIRTSVKVGTAVFSALLAILYLHESVRLLLPYLPQPIVLRLLVVMLCGSTVFFLSLGQSLGSQRVVFASWLSIFTFFAWAICIICAHAKGVLYVDGGSSSVWRGILTIAFTFSTSSTLPLYASLKSGHHGVSTAKTPKTRSFRLLSLFSVSCATLLILPLVIFAALPNVPATISLPAAQATRTALASSSAAILLLGAPQPLLTIPILPIRVARTTINLTRTLIIPAIIILSLALSLVPPSSFTYHTVTIITLAAFALALASTYLFPCVLHISVHTFKRPLNIVMPRTPMLPTPSGSLAAPPDARNIHDELLQRKERALQQKQLRKRIVWDIGVWAQLGVCAVGGALALSSLVSR